VKPNERQVYTRFDDYWRGWSKGQVSRVEYIVQLDPAAARLMLERGDVDMTAIYSNDAIEPLRANPQVNVYLKEFPAPQYMMMNTKVKPLDDVRVRRAIQHAWSRAAWKASLGGVVGEQLAPAPLEVLGEDYKAVTYDYDLAKAKQLLTEAGYPNGGFKITHYYLEGDTHKKSMGELLQAELRTLGIQMEIRSLIVARMFEMVRDFGKTKNPASAIDMITIFTPARIFDAHNYLDWHFNSKAWEYGRNFMYYENPEVDRLLAQAAAALDDDKARPLYRQVSDIVMKDAPTIMIERLVGKMYTRKNIEGFYFNLKMYPTTVVFYDIRKR
jgi:peptide/nickel transport system substrate-binding protein